MICFEVRINDGDPIVAGAPSLSVLTAIATYVVERKDLALRVGGLACPSDSSHEHVDWVHTNLEVGDKVEIRVVDAAHGSEPVSREAVDPDLEEKEKRRYYEALKREFEGQ